MTKKYSMTYQKLSAAGIAALLGVTLACGEAEPPTSPASVDEAVTDAASDGGTLKVSAPAPVSPTGGIEVDDDDPDLVIDNATGTFLANAPVSYVFEVFDAEHRLVYQSAPIPSGNDGRTSHEIGIALDFDKGFEWRAYAVYQSRRGPLSSSASFRTFSRFGVSCAHLGNELAIVECRRAQYGFMSVPERVEFLSRVAYDLNRAPAEHAPYGILIKSTGHSCLGYSCDVICSNTGMHRQWDVLSDEDSSQIPVWSRLGEIAVRPCEAVQ
jgi:hypothetical protein